MNTYDFVHLALYAIGGGIRGKTKLQKTIYFLGRLTNRLDELGYSAHYYGPYSSEVAEAADRLRAIGFLEQSCCTFGAVGSLGFEVIRYDFCLNEDGKNVAEFKKNLNKELWASIEKAVSKLKKAGDFNYNELSVAAKTDFLLRARGGQASKHEIQEIAGKFGWSVGKQEIDEAAQLLVTIGLVKLIRQS